MVGVREVLMGGVVRVGMLGVGVPSRPSSFLLTVVGAHGTSHVRFLALLLHVLRVRHHHLLLLLLVMMLLLLLAHMAGTALGEEMVGPAAVNGAVV